MNIPPLRSVRLGTPFKYVNGFAFGDTLTKTYTQVPEPHGLRIKWRIQHQPMPMYHGHHHVPDLASSPREHHKGWPTPGAKPPAKFEVCIPYKRCTPVRGLLRVV